MGTCSQVKLKLGHVINNKLVWNDFLEANFQLLLYDALCYMHAPVVYPHLFSIRICFDFAIKNFVGELGWCRKWLLTCLFLILDWKYILIPFYCLVLWLFCFWFFWDGVSLCSPGCLEFLFTRLASNSDLPASASPVLWLKGEPPHLSRFLKHLRTLPW